MRDVRDFVQTRLLYQHRGGLSFCNHNSYDKVANLDALLSEKVTNAIDRILQINVDFGPSLFLERRNGVNVYVLKDRNPEVHFDQSFLHSVKVATAGLSYPRI